MQTSFLDYFLKKLCIPFLLYTELDIYSLYITASLENYVLTYISLM